MMMSVFHMVGLDRGDVHFTCRRIPNHPKGPRKKSFKEETERADRIAQQLLMEEERAKEEEEEKRLVRASRLREKKKRRQKRRKEDQAGSLKEPPEETTTAEDDEEEATTAPTSPQRETNVSEALLCCAYTGARMQDPVLLADGRAYERAFAQLWLCNNCTSPVSGQPLRHTKVVEDALLISVL